jgi:hypothetical protein
MFPNSYWLEILPQYISMCLVSWYNISAWSDVLFEEYVWSCKTS